MSRRIVTTRLQAQAGSATVDTYFDRVVKYIPADIVAAWTAVTSILAAQTVVPAGRVTTPTDQVTALWAAFAFGVILTFLWTLKQTTLPNSRLAWTQSIVATVAFIVWVFTLGGPFATLDFYKPWYGALLIIGYSLLVGAIIPPEDS